MMMMRLALLLAFLVLALGCQNHLFFAESAHMGLKAKFAVEGPSPFEVSIGYRRGLVAIIPKRTDAVNSPEPRVKEKVDEANKKTVEITVQDNREDLMSLYTVFRANLGMGDPIDICHFLATGRAAGYLLSNLEAVEGVTHNICTEGQAKQGGSK